MLSILVSGRTDRHRFVHREGPLEFGRGPQREVPRRVLKDPAISNNQFCLQEREDGRIDLRNLSTRVSIQLADGSVLAPGAEQMVALPVRLHVGETLIEIECVLSGKPTADLTLLRTIEPPLTGGMAGRASGAHLGTAPAAEELARWFESLTEVQRAAASSPSFFAEVARAVVELIGLDSGLVLLRRGDDWAPVATHPPQDERGDHFSRSIVATVMRERRTFFQGVPLTAASLEGVTAVVASPILDESRTVIGAVYGERRGTARSAEIRPLEAQLTQVLASTVAVGLARLHSEAEAARRRVQFEQFFTSDLAVELDRDPTLLEGHEREVTVMFADIRGFSGISERLSPQLACELIRDVMEHLTAQIMAQAGVVVDYIGDGLLAMWNAPLDQPDHAIRAARSALAMRDGLPALNRRWQDKLGKPLGLGIGINSGPALVGNTGSQRKFKYGPLGHTVNLASRVEGATKQLGVGLLFTGSTFERLGDSFATRKLCHARVIGIAGGVDLHELNAGIVSPDWLARRDSYESALSLYEAGRWSEACQALYPLLNTDSGSYDLPGLTLLSRAVECLKSPPLNFDPVFEIRSK